MSKRKRKGFFRRNYIAILFIVLLIGGVFYYINDIEKKEIIENTPPHSASTYQMLENRDSVTYQANILLEENMSILKLSQLFYGNEIFWPYIFQSNHEIDNILDLPKSVVLKIPRVNKDLIDINNKESVDHARKLADSLLIQIEKERKKQLESKSYEDW